MKNTKILKLGPYELLYSYETLVCIWDGTEWWRTTEKFSNTTQKHITQWYMTRPNAKVNRITQTELEAMLLPTI